jgi:hypothetical protein
MGSLLFVHGTGVRTQGYRSTVARMTRGVREHVPGLEIQTCLWGPTRGATLAKDGRSIPDFEGVKQADEKADARRLLWELLSMDATYELRELAGMPASGAGPMDADVAALAGQVAQLADEESHDRLPPEVPHELWDEAVAAVAASPALEGSARAARRVTTAVREAAARACVAGLQARLSVLQAPQLSELERDALVRAMVDRLGGEEAGAVRDWLVGKLKGVTSRWATSKLVRHRDVLSNAAYPAAGDVLRYQSRGQPIRDFIAKAIADCPDEVTIVAHSLGGIACVDLLVLEKQPKVRQLVTVGSQAPLLYELGALVSLAPDEQLPEHFPGHWLNVYDRHDVLSYLAAPIFGTHSATRSVVDMPVDSGQPFPEAHSAYWDTPDFWSRLLGKMLPL